MLLFSHRQRSISYDDRESGTRLAEFLLGKSEFSFLRDRQPLIAKGHQRSAISAYAVPCSSHTHRRGLPARHREFSFPSAGSRSESTRQFDVLISCRHRCTYFGSTESPKHQYYYPATVLSYVLFRNISTKGLAIFKLHQRSSPSTFIWTLLGCVAT